MCKKVLCVGLLCADIVSYVPKFILEDSDQRCLKQTWERGGNAANNATVLARLGSPVEFLGTLAQDHLLEFFKEDMTKLGIHFSNCPIFKNYQTPTSIVISSVETGSRTIIHNNGGLPELTFDYFKGTIQLDQYKWVHIEGRNPEELLKILEYIREYNNKATTEVSEGLNYKKRKLPVSIEVEKARKPLAKLLQYADVAFVGREFAELHGAKNFKEAAILGTSLVQKGTLVICPWGDQGAAYCIAGDKPEIETVEAFPPDKIVDSLGAGDTFDASVIHALSQGLDIRSSIRFGCKVAGGKLSVHGFTHVGQIAQGLPEFQQIEQIQEKSTSP
jgi:ketohexokinase